MTPRELFERLHLLFMAELERHHRHPATVATLVRVIGKHGTASDHSIYGRYLHKDPTKRQTPRVGEMQRMCQAWTDAGYRSIDVRLSIVLEEG